MIRSLPAVLRILSHAGGKLAKRFAFTAMILMGFGLATGCQTQGTRPPIQYKVIPHGSQTRNLHEFQKPKATVPKASAAIAHAPKVSKQDLVVYEARRWMGAPYRIGGNTRQGVDCSGFTTQVILQATGLKLPRTAATQFKFGTPVSTKTLMPGDLVFFQTSREAPITHVGIYMGGGQFAHASTKNGVIMTSLSHTYYSQAYRGARRVLVN
ncbi:MAG: C40 family peptidase [Verrucomicrobiales bacterium]